jgi:tRNA(Ile)-lysidine synthase
VLSADALLSDLAAARGLLVAVSGGPDSLALLALAADWSKGAGRPPVFAATFDHGFRDASRDEAQACGRIAQDLGIPHAILDWTGAKPVSRIQEEARDARYDALVAHACAIGADVLLTAHHGDDQAETILFRLIRGSAIGGLAGMRARRDLGGIIHVRPLLQQRKADLVALCDDRGLSFIIDPSNADPRFARTGLRRLAPLLEDAGMGVDAFARLAMRAARAEEALVAGTADLATRAVISRRPTQTRIDASVLAEAPAEFALRVLAAEITGMGRAPRLEQVEQISDRLRAAIVAKVPFRATLGGSLINLKRGSEVVISPEAPRATPVIP